MRRRPLLSSALPLGVTSLAGCLFGIGGRRGVNPNLELRNATVEAVDLVVTVELNDPPGSRNRGTVYDDTISLPAGETRVLEVLGDNQYEVTVSNGERTMSFWTRPICDSAHTHVVVTASGTLVSDVEDCE